MDIGHNQPPAFDALKDRCEVLIDTANRWLAERPEISNDDEADKCKDFIQQLRDEYKAAEVERKKEKAPHAEAGKAVDAKFKPLLALLETAGKMLKPKMTQWLQKQEAIRVEAAKKAEEEALRKIEAAEEAAQAANTVQGVVAAEEAVKAADEAVKTAGALEKSRAQTKGQYGERAMSLRVKRYGVITDLDAVYRHYRNDPRLRAILQSMADADIRAKREVPGVEVREERSAA